MEEELGMQQLQHEVAQKAAVEVTQSMAVRQAVQQDAIESRSALQAASTDTGQRLTAAAEDLSEQCGEDVSEAAEAWLDDAQESLQAAQDNAAAFFERVDELVDAGDDSLGQQLLVIADQAAQAMQDFAVQVDQQGRDLDAAVSTALVEDNTTDLDDAFAAATARTAALQDELSATMEQLNQQVTSALVDNDRARQLQESDWISANPQQPVDVDAIATEALERLESDQYQTGELLEMQPHRAAKEARAEMDVSGYTHQSAHAGPQKALESLEDYNPNDMLTRVMDRDKHSEMDAGWKREFRERADSGERDISVQELYDTVARSIDAANQLTDNEKESHKAHLSDELVNQLGLDGDDRVRLPYAARS